MCFIGEEILGLASLSAAKFFEVGESALPPPLPTRGHVTPLVRVFRLLM